MTLGEDIYIYLMTKMLNNAIVFWNIAISWYILKNWFFSNREILYPRNVNFASIREI